MLPSEIIITSGDIFDRKYKIILIHISNDVIIYFMYYSRSDFKDLRMIFITKEIIQDPYIILQRKNLKTSIEIK